MEDIRFEPQQGAGEENVARRVHPAVLTAIGFAICAVLAVGAIFAIGIGSPSKAASPIGNEPALTQTDADKDALMPVVTNESGEIVSDDGMSVSVKVFEGEIPEGGDIVK
jgi:hypothetical protein